MEKPTPSPENQLVVYFIPALASKRQSKTFYRKILGPTSLVRAKAIKTLASDYIFTIFFTNLIRYFK